LKSLYLVLMLVGFSAQMKSSEAIKIARSCLSVVKDPVQKKESVTAITRKDASGTQYWHVTVALEPPTPEGARFLDVYDSSKIEYINFHRSKKFTYQNGICKETH
jgi:hypothetical protein